MVRHGVHTDNSSHGKRLTSTDTAALPVRVSSHISNFISPNIAMGPAHKRKRSLQDSSVGVLKMSKTLEQLRALAAEFEEIEETEHDSEMPTIMEHVHKLEEILKTAKFPVCIPYHRSA